MTDQPFIIVRAWSGEECEHNLCWQCAFFFYQNRIVEDILSQDEMLRMKHGVMESPGQGSIIKLYYPFYYPRKQDKRKIELFSPFLCSNK